MDLKSREKKIVAVCVALVLAALVQIAVISPSVKKRDELERSIHKAQIQLEELRLLENEYKQILVETKQITRKMGGGSRNFELLSFLNQTAVKLKVRKNIDSMRPSHRELGGNLVEDTIELELEGISLENLTTFLHEIERKGAAVAIASIRIRPMQKLGGLKVSMRVTAVSTS